MSSISRNAKYNEHRTRRRRRSAAALATTAPDSKFGVFFEFVRSLEARRQKKGPKEKKQSAHYDAIVSGMTYQTQPPLITVRPKPTEAGKQKLEKPKFSSSSF
jgi:hypothetical protein